MYGPEVKYRTKDPNHRILARQRSRFTYYFYIPGIAKGGIAAGIAPLPHPPDGLLAWLGPAIGAGAITGRMASLIWVRR